MIQTAIVALLVIGSSAYAAWSLMPSAMRRSLARKLLALPLPDRVAAPLRKHAASDGAGCACDGCDRSARPTAQAKTKATAPTIAPITFHPRANR